VGHRLKKTIRRDIAVQRAAELLAKQTDPTVALDALGVLQEVMAHFYHKARVLKTLGADAPFDQIDDLMDRAGRWAKELAVFRFAKIQAMRLATDPNAPTLPEQMSIEELRESIMADFERLREYGVLSLPSHEVNGNGKEPEEAEGVVPREE
jgi:hypothetical protein